MEMKLPSIPQRIVIAVLAVVMVVGLAPTQAFAADAASSDAAQTQMGGAGTQAAGEDASADAAESGISTAAQDEAQVQDDSEAIPAGQVQLTLKGIHSAQINYFKLYTYADGVKGATDLLDGVELVDSPDGGNQKMYVTTVDAGDYWVEGYDENDACNGGIQITVAEGQDNAIKIQRAYQIYSTNRKTVDGKSVYWELGTDYTVDFVVKDASGNVHANELGEANSWGTVYASGLFIAGGTINATFAPAGEFADEYMPTSVAKSASQTTAALSISASIPKALSITVNAPAGSTISVGNMATYYVYTWFDGTVTKNDETGVSETFRVPASMTGNRFYRVQNPDGVTYWKYNNWTADATVEVTADDLHIGDTDFGKSTVYRFEKNVYDRADIYLNINQQGYKNMQVGDTFELNVFRNWMAIESFFNSKVALPDMHYTVIDTEGNPSDVVSITPDANNSSVATMTANKAGTAIVMVSYDAMTHMDGQSSTSSKEFSAIWPECTGMFIVNVGADGSSIQTNMKIDRVEEGKEPTSIDAEHDILFYLGNEGASYSFTPESGTTVTVDRSVVTDSMTFNGFTSEGVATNAETGEVTVSGLTTGRHIIKVEKDGVANYQVVTARQTSYEVLDADGNKIEDLAQVKAGDTIQLQFSNLVMPCEKMSGVYNMNASIYYKGEDGTMFRSNPGSSFGVYDFSGNPVRQLITITIPKYWDGSSYSLTGAIKMGGFMTYNPGGHRGVTYAAGVNPNYNAPEANSVLASMPNLSISLGQTDFLTGTFSFTDEAGNKIDAKDFTKIVVKDAEGNEVSVADDGTFKAVAEKYTYATYIEGYRYATGEVEVTEEGDNIFNVKMEASSDGAWDGVSTSQPEQDADGVYQIKTGAELAWINEQSNLSKDAVTNSALALCNDIDLAGYPWAKGIRGNGGIQFDGAGHAVTDLNASAALIDTVDKNGSVSNLTVEGVTTGPAGIVKTLNGGSIVNCVSDVDITPTDTSYIGGVVGTAANDTTVSKCVFTGTINAPNASYVGGVAGRSAGSNFKLVNCYNTGDVTAKGYVGGVVGMLVNNTSATACYSTGKVTGTAANVGGFVGSASGANIASCYSAGTVTGGNQFAGSSSGSTYDRCYAPAGEGLTDDCAELLSDMDLRSPDLPAWYFAPTCSGYPALVWQTDVTFHEASGDGITVNPNCLSKGYTTYTCKHCNGIFKADYTESTGHIAGDDMVVHPTYCEYTCKVCDTKVKEYSDSALANLTFGDEGISSVSLESASNYPWVGTDTGLESSCQGVNNGVSESSLKFTLDYGGTVSFDYAVSSEARYDKLTITLQNPDGSSTTVCDGISGSSTGAFSSGDLAAGQYQLKLCYKKDSSGNTGSDKGWISNFKATGKSETDAALAAKTAISAIGTPVTLDSETAIIAARAAYDGLPASAQSKVDNYGDLVKAEAELATLKAPEADKAAAAAAIAAIDAIGTPVTLEKSDKVEAARTAYNALTDSQKALVTNYQTLVDAESTVAALNKSMADAVTLRIYSLGKVRPGVSDEAVADARSAYNALTDGQKALVGNYQILLDAEAALDSGYAKQVSDKIEAIGDVTLDSEDAIKAAREAYDALTESQKGKVGNYSDLEAAEAALYNLKVPVILTDELPAGSIGDEYEATIEATGVPAPTVTVTGLPDGLEFNAETGVISGTPTKIGTFSVKVEAANATDTVSSVYTVDVYNKSELRVAGAGRIDTMSQILDKSVADGSQSDVILTTAWNYADALSASGLVGALDAALVTTDGDSLSYAAKQQISRISDGSVNVHVLGGSGAISDDVVKELEAMSCVGTVDRIAGNGRVETAGAIYEYGIGNWSDTCVIANAWNYADALSIGAYCANNSVPIFGATEGAINEDQAAAIKAGGFTKIVIVGGSSAVDPDAVKAALEGVGDDEADAQDDDAPAFEYLVLAGTGRTETSKAIVDWVCGNDADAVFQPASPLDASNVCFATAWNYADALAGVNLAYAYEAPIMLVDGNDASKAAIADVAQGMRKCWILGGNSSVSSDIENWIVESM